MTLFSLLKNITTNNSLIPLITELNEIIFNIGYDKNHEYIDNYFLNLYKNLMIDEEMFDISTDIISQYNMLSKQVLYANLEAIKRIYEINKSSYKPTENYDRYEEFDKTTITSNLGARETKSLNDNVKVKTINSTVGYNSKELTTTDEQEIINSGNGANNKIENIIQSNSVTDITSTSGSGENGIINNHIHGNIGVTTTTAMLTEHEKFWKNYNFFNFVYTKIFQYITIPMYE